MAASGWPSTTTGSSDRTKTEYVTNHVDVYSLNFDTGADEFAQWTVVMPSDWDGSTVTGIFYWTCTGGSANQTVKFYLQGRSYGNDDAIDQAWGSAVGVADTWIANGDVHISSATAAVTLGGTPAAGELVQFRVYRDVSEDDLAGDAMLLAVRVTFTRA